MATPTKERRGSKVRTTKDSDAGAGEFMRTNQHPLKDVAELLRKVVADADRRLEESVKWNAPSFAVRGDHRVTLNMSAKDRVRVVFHRGAKAKDSKGSGRLIDDPHGLLEWASDDRAIVSFCSVEEVRQARSSLRALIRKWIDAAG
ncbi:MAG: DUF1801 domain-containing protein [Phycisphaeraceae bacterium]|nr:DUF1801 domain-containing protein [Phycisphaeraceae bacterium]